MTHRRSEGGSGRPPRGRVFRFVLVLFLVALLGPLCAFGDDPRPRKTYRLKVVVDTRALDWIARTGLDVAGRNLAEGWVEVITDDAGREALIAQGYEPQTIAERVEPAPADVTTAETTRAPTDPLGDTNYTDSAELEAYLQQVIADHPAIVRLENIGTSIEGRPIWAVMISDNAAVDEDELGMLFTGALHAREVMTPEAVIDVIDHLTDNYGIDPDITNHVDSYQVWCVPMVNPDGVEIVFNQDQLWRKNARDNDDNGRVTWKDGVDINRNFGWGWGNQCQGSSDATSAATYRGPFEVSEPETRAVIELGRRVRPVFYIEYHSYGEDVFYAMGCDPDAFSPTLSTIADANQSISRVIGEQYAARIVQADGEPGFTAAPFGNRVDGIGRDHQAHEHGTIAFVTELNSAGENGFKPFFNTWRQPTVEGQRPGWLWLLERIAGPAIGGTVKDALTGLPVAADVTLDQMSLPDGRRLTSREDTGRFHLIVVPGSYTLRLGAPGYQDVAVPLTVGATWQPLDIAMLPTGSTLLLRESFEDPTDAGAWTIGSAEDTATSGIWEWGEPLQTHAGDVLNLDLEFGAPPLDRTPGQGSRAFVTGNTPGVAIADDDVDGGTTSLVSPPFDVDGWYAVELGFQHWLRVDTSDPLDGLTLEASNDGGTGWSTLASWNEDSASGAAAQAWTPLGVRLDDTLQPGPDVRVRFRAFDDGQDNVVEVAIDELEIRGFSIAAQGRVADLRFSSPQQAVWQPVPGADDMEYEIVRGDLGSLSSDALAVDLGSLTCVQSSLGGTSVTLDFDVPPSGAGWFYLARFRLGFSSGDLGTSSDGTPRSASGGCPP